jgi:hypothetical protein
MGRKAPEKMTVTSVRALKPGEWATDPGNRGEGSLQARRLASGAVWFYFRYADADRVQHRIPLGIFDPDASPDDQSRFTLATARDKARSLIDRYRAGDKDLRGTLAAEDEAKRREREAAKAAEAAREAQSERTLGRLLEAYADSLGAAGKTSAGKVRSTIKRHVCEPFPELWKKPAVEVTPDDCLTIVERPNADGKAREAAKLRSYLRAAYAAAINARTRPGALPALRAFGLQVNPVRDVGCIQGAARTRDRALSVAELRAFWKRTADLPATACAAVRFYLLTGGQRIQQLARATVADVDADAEALKLLDAKGRRTTPRAHWVPLLKEARECIATMGEPRLGPHVWTLTNGETPMNESSVRDHVAAVCKAMIEAEECAERFTPADLRRTIETRLAALGVGLEVRAQLQSHGLGGIQARHYDRHNYLPEKRAALEKLRALLTGKAATVTDIKAAGRKTRTGGRK